MPVCPLLAQPAAEASNAGLLGPCLLWNPSNAPRPPTPPHPHPRLQVRPNPDFLQAAAQALGPPGASRPAVLYGPGAPLDADASASFVSKEAFVSIAPNGTGQVDGEVRGPKGGAGGQRTGARRAGEGGPSGGGSECGAGGPL